MSGLLFGAMMLSSVEVSPADRILGSIVGGLFLNQEDKKKKIQDFKPQEKIPTIVVSSDFA